MLSKNTKQRISRNKARRSRWQNKIAREFDKRQIRQRTNDHHERREPQVAITIAPLGAVAFRGGITREQLYRFIKPEAIQQTETN